MTDAPPLMRTLTGLGPVESPTRLTSAPTHPWQRAFDLTLALTIAVVTLPLLGVAALLVRLTSSGPVFYTQVRSGMGGWPFRIVKLRTMWHNCEADSGIRWATAGDRRVTPVGRVLRALHVDELPQLWNVVRGEMSVVGPRPERPEIIPHLVSEVPHYRDRLAVRPGLTGLAQIQLPADTAVEQVAAKVRLDRVYIDRRGLGLDLRIVAGTALYLAGLSYAAVGRLAGLPGPTARPSEVA